MLCRSSNLIGFVPTLEALPLVATLSSITPWQMIPCPSYGRVIRQLLAGQLSTGLLPLELILTEIVGRPALIDRWVVPTVLQAAPIELVMSKRKMKLIQQTAQNRGSSATKSLVIGIESRNSLTRHQFIAWQKLHPTLEGSKVLFKMLPMELMVKAILAETIDGFLAPTPWGIAAESNSECIMIPEFTSGKLAQQLVLCCHRSVADANQDSWISLPEKINNMRSEILSMQSVRDRTIGIMGTLGRPHCDTASLIKSTELYALTMDKDDFIPDQAWLNKQIEKLARLIPIVARAEGLHHLAKSLAFNGSGSDVYSSGTIIDTRLLNTSADQPSSVLAEW